MTRKAIPETAYGLLRQAIREHFCITARYQGRLRRFCPYALGTDDAQKPKTLVWQYGGQSSGRLPQWRCFGVDDLTKLARNDDRWHDEIGGHSVKNTCVTNVEVEVGKWRSR